MTVVNSEGDVRLSEKIRRFAALHQLPPSHPLLERALELDRAIEDFFTHKTMPVREFMDFLNDTRKFFKEYEDHAKPSAPSIQLKNPV